MNWVTNGQNSLANDVTKVSNDINWVPNGQNSLANDVTKASNDINWVANGQNSLDKSSMLNKTYTSCFYTEMRWDFTEGTEISFVPFVFK